ncbi:hypothetical protein EVAR_38440_1 [Eumeta japonica]|uniref:Uncharacterized protein n=1 Tax=Eumeta variegata TaxID=151549 RepID=A0A4C1WY61_EUMVA|nr:hypothetical protein EVAR_38440_1 [Eumeta japonica]
MPEWKGRVPLTRSHSPRRARRRPADPPPARQQSAVSERWSSARDDPSARVHRYFTQRNVRLCRGPQTESPESGGAPRLYRCSQLRKAAQMNRSDSRRFVNIVTAHLFRCPGEALNVMTPSPYIRGRPKAAAWLAAAADCLRAAILIGYKISRTRCRLLAR